MPAIATTTRLIDNRLRREEKEGSDVSGGVSVCVLVIA